MSWQIALPIILSTGLSIAASLTLLWVGRKLSRMDKRGDSRVEENVLMMRGIIVLGGFLMAVSTAMKNNHFNGEVGDAAEEFMAFRADLDTYLIRQNAAKNRAA